MNNHWDDELLSAYLDGELTSEERLRIDTLLANHADAQQSLDELRALQTGLATLPRYKLPADFAEQVLLRIKTIDRSGSGGPATAGGNGQEPRTIYFDANSPQRGASRRALRYIGYTAVAAAAAIALIVWRAEPERADRPVAQAVPEPVAAPTGARAREVAGAKSALPAESPAFAKTPTEGVATLNRRPSTLAKPAAEKDGDAVAIDEPLREPTTEERFEKKASELNATTAEPAVATAPAAGTPPAARSDRFGDRIAGVTGRPGVAGGGGGLGVKKGASSAADQPTRDKKSDRASGFDAGGAAALSAGLGDASQDAKAPIPVRQVEVDVSADALQKGELLSFFSRQNVAVNDEPLSGQGEKEQLSNLKERLDQLQKNEWHFGRGNYSRKGMGDTGRPGEVHVVTVVLDEPQYNALVDELAKHPGFRVGNYQLHDKQKAIAAPAEPQRAAASGPAPLAKKQHAESDQLR